MARNFEALKGEYAALLGSMVVTRYDEIQRTADRLIKLIPRYREVEAAIGVPAVWLAPINERESSSNFHTYLGNGDPLGRVTTHVPAGRGPFFGDDAWERGAKEALHLDHMDRVASAAPGWTWCMFCFQSEAWNGFGPRNHGIHTGYDWAGTNHYRIGKYVADGVWNAGSVDTQLGTVPMAKALVARDAKLDLPHDEAVIAVPPSPPSLNSPDLDDTRQLQTVLNILVPGENLVVDGSFGRMTRLAVRHFQAAHGLDADGIPGPLTRAAILQALKGNSS